MRSFSKNPFSQSVAPDGILAASRADWPERAVICPRPLAGKVNGRTDYMHPLIYIMYIAPSDIWLCGKCAKRVSPTKTRESLMFTKDRVFSSGSAAAEVARGAISNADWWKSSQGRSLRACINEAKAKT